MYFFKRSDCKFEFYDNGKLKEIVFPETAYGIPVFNSNKRYVAIGSVNKIYVYDFEKDVITTLLHKSKNTIRYIRFDKNDNLYYIDGNNIGTIDIKKSEDTVLYNVGKTPHNPQNLGVSPNARHVSFCRYRSNGLCLYLFDTENKELKDYKISLFHYAWLDDDHIVWSKSGGLKILDINTGKSKLILKDHKSLIKKINKEDAKMFDMFKEIDASSLYVDLDLIKVLNGDIYFTLAISCYSSDPNLGEAIAKSLYENGYFSSEEYYSKNPVRENTKKHYGVWSMNIEKNTAKYHYEFSGEYRKANSGYKFLMSNGNLAWARNGWHIFDGITETTLPGDWEKAVCFDDLNS